MQILPATGNCRRILYATKIHWLASLTDGLEEVPDDVALIWRYGPLTAEHQRLLGTIVKTLGVPVRFVGDLDPLDLLTYATLAAIPGLEAIDYLGIADAWMELCDLDPQGRGGLGGLSRVCIAMDPEEVTAWAELTTAAVAWSRPVGPRGAALLGSGLKLELEGASNPALYSPGFRRRLLAHLFA